MFSYNIDQNLWRVSATLKRCENLSSICEKLCDDDYKTESIGVTLSILLKH